MIKTESSSEVTNKSSKCDAQSYLVDLVGTSGPSFSYTLGIRYCDESGDPTKTGIGVSNMLNYKPSSKGSTSSYSFKLTGLSPNKIYKYCAFIQCYDFIDYGEIKTFETPYININSWEQTISERRQDANSYIYTFQFDQNVSISGNIEFVNDWGFYSSYSNRYISIGSQKLGLNYSWIKVETDQSTYSATYTPYLLFKNGEYYLGTPQQIYGGYPKSANIKTSAHENIESIEMAGNNN